MNLNAATLILAKIELPGLEGVGSEGGQGSHFMSDAMIVVGVGFGLLVLLAIWAIFFRKRDKSHDSGIRGAVLREGGVEDGSSSRKRRHKRRRREHRGRNPTLAETGGLPPVRSENPPGL